MGTDDLHHGIEPLAVTDLQTETVYPGEMDQLVGFSRGDSNRLFDEHVFARLQTRLGYLVMGGSRNRHADDIDVREEVVQRKRPDAVFVANGLGPLRRLIRHADEFHSWKG